MRRYDWGQETKPISPAPATPEAAQPTPVPREEAAPESSPKNPLQAGREKAKARREARAAKKGAPPSAPAEAALKGETPGGEKTVQTLEDEIAASHPERMSVQAFGAYEKAISKRLTEQTVAEWTFPKSELEAKFDQAFKDKQAVVLDTPANNGRLYFVLSTEGARTPKYSVSEMGARGTGFYRRPASVYKVSKAKAIAFINERMRTYASSGHYELGGEWGQEGYIREAIRQRQPINAEVVDAVNARYEGTAEEQLDTTGYVRDGDLYVFKPGEPAPALGAEAKFRTKLTPAEEYQETLRRAGLADKYVQVPKSTEPESRKWELYENLNYAAGRSPRDIATAKEAAEAEYRASPTEMQLKAASGAFDGSDPKDMARADVAAVRMMSRMFAPDASETTQKLAQHATYNLQRKASDVSFSMNLLKNRLVTPDGRLAELNDLISKPNDIEAEKLKHAKSAAERDPVFDAALRRANAVLKKLAGVEIADSAGNKVKFDPNAFTPEQLMDDTFMRNATMAVKQARSSLGDKAYEWWRNSILSGPATLFVVNPGGNLLHIAEEMRVQRPLEVFLNSLPFFHSADAPTKRSTKAYFKYAAAAKELAEKNMIDSFRNEQAQIGPQANKFDMGDQAIGGKFGKAVRTPQNVLVAVDQYFRTVATVGGAADFATRKFEALVKSGAKRADGKPLSEADYENFLDSEMREGTDSWNKAEEQANRWLFQEKPPKLAQAFISMRSDPFFGWFWKYALPFVTTPANVIKTAARKTVLGSLPFAWGAVRGQFSGTEAARAEGIRRGAEQAVAWALTAALYSIAQKDENGMPRITGNAQTSGTYRPGEREFEQRNLPPMSIRIGDKWYSYARLDPFGTALAATVDMMNAYDAAKNKDGAQIGARLQNMLIGTFSDKTYIKTVGDIIDAVRNADPGKWGQIVSGTAAGFVPNIFKAFARASDEYVRDMRNRGKGAEYAKTAGERLLQQAVPLPSLAPIPKYDIYGRPVEKLGGALNALLPTVIRDAGKLTDVDRMLKNYSDAHPDEPSALVAPPKPPTYTFLGHKGTVTLTDEEYEKYQKLAGERAAKRLAGMSFKIENPTERDVKRAHSVFEDARAFAKTRIGFEVRERLKRERKA